MEQISRVERFRPSGKGKHLTGQGGSVNEFSGGAANVGYQCRANAEENEREVICPVRNALSCQQSRLQLPVKSFYESFYGYAVARKRSQPRK